MGQKNSTNAKTAVFRDILGHKYTRQYEEQTIKRRTNKGSRKSIGVGINENPYFGLFRKYPELLFPNPNALSVMV